MKTYFLALLLSVVSLPALAAEPFVSGALQYNVAFPHYNTTSWLHDFGCWGSDVAAGLAWPDLSVYGGHQAVTSPIYEETYHWRSPSTATRTSTIRSAWRERRWLVGARWHLNGRGESPVKPTLGAALSYGETRLEWKEAQTEGERTDIFVSQSRKTETLGFLLEFGILWRTGTPVDLSLMAQAHRVEPDFGNDGHTFTVDRYVVLMPGWQLALRYRFPEIR